MKISYDPAYNIAYIQIRDKTKDVETIRISDEINIDLSADGKVFGIELLNANDQLGLSREAPFEFVNEKTSAKKELPLDF